MESRGIKLLIVFVGVILLSSTAFIVFHLLNRNEEKLVIPYTEEEQSDILEKILAREVDSYQEYLKDGRRLSFTFPDGDTPLEKLIYNNDFSGAEQILETGFDLNLIESIDPVDTITSIIGYNGGRRFDQIDDITIALINQVKDRIEEPDEHGFSLLINAIITDNYRVVEELVKHVIQINRYYNGYTPVLYAAYKGTSPDIVRLLVRNGGNVHAEAPNGDNVLMYAVVALNTEIVNFLIQNTSVNLNATNNQGRTALHIAVVLSDVDMVRTLLATSIDTTITDDNGHSSYELALRYHESYDDEDTAAIVQMFEQRMNE